MLYFILFCIFRVVGMFFRGFWIFWAVSKLFMLIIWFLDICWIRRVISCVLGVEVIVLVEVVVMVIFFVILLMFGELMVGEVLGLLVFWCWVSSFWRRVLVMFWVMLGLVFRRFCRSFSCTEWGRFWGVLIRGELRVIDGEVGLVVKNI